ncbi:hypothetical protein M3J09_007551 [Ascochyta lentis]
MQPLKSSPNPTTASDSKTPTTSPRPPFLPPTKTTKTEQAKPSQAKITPPKQLSTQHRPTLDLKRDQHAAQPLYPSTAKSYINKFYSSNNQLPRKRESYELS